MSQIVYSAQKSGFIKGRIYQNPRFFDGVLQPGATSVVVVGDFPRVVEAYKAAGIPVATTKDPKNLPNPEAGDVNVSQEAHTDHPDVVVIGKGKDVGDLDPPSKEGRNVEVPEGFEELAFKELKTLAAKLQVGSTEPATTDFASKKDVVDFIKEFAKKG